MDGMSAASAPDGRSDQFRPGHEAHHPMTSNSFTSTSAISRSAKEYGPNSFLCVGPIQIPLESHKLVMGLPQGIPGDDPLCYAAAQSCFQNASSISSGFTIRQMCEGPVMTRLFNVEELTRSYPTTSIFIKLSSILRAWLRAQFYWYVLKFSKHPNPRFLQMNLHDMSYISKVNVTGASAQEKYEQKLDFDTWRAQCPSSKPAPA